MVFLIVSCATAVSNGVNIYQSIYLGMVVRQEQCPLCPLAYLEGGGSIGVLGNKK